LNLRIDSSSSSSSIDGAVASPGMRPFRLPLVLAIDAPPLMGELWNVKADCGGGGAKVEEVTAEEERDRWWEGLTTVGRFRVEEAMIGRVVRLEEADGWRRRGCVGVLVRDEEAEAESEGLLLCC